MTSKDRYFPSLPPTRLFKECLSQLLPKDSAVCTRTEDEIVQADVELKLGRLFVLGTGIRPVMICVSLKGRAPPLRSEPAQPDSPNRMSERYHVLPSFSVVTSRSRGLLGRDEIDDRVHQRLPQEGRQGRLRICCVMQQSQGRGSETRASKSSPVLLSFLLRMPQAR